MLLGLQSWSHVLPHFLSEAKELRRGRLDGTVDVCAGEEEVVEQINRGLLFRVVLYELFEVLLVVVAAE